jgi:hypothetical protein
MNGKQDRKIENWANKIKEELGKSGYILFESAVKHNE